LDDQDQAKATDAVLEARRRRARFRAWHRGMRETDLILGRFADTALAEMSLEEIKAFESLLEHSDGDLLAWIIGQRPVPADADAKLIARIRAAQAGIAAADRH
jgi:antitoxin CptB